MVKSSNPNQNNLRFYATSLWKALMSLGLVVVVGLTLTLFAIIILALTEKVIGFPQLVWLPVIVLWFFVAFKSGEANGYKKGFATGDANGYERGLLVNQNGYDYRKECVILNPKKNKSFAKPSPDLHEIEILGVKLSKKNYPSVYKWAKNAPERAELVVKKILEEEGWSDPNLALNILDLDLSHLAGYNKA